MSSRFFSRLNYSSVNEDWRTELAGLQLESSGRVLCVTGSGDRPLDLLASAPVEVVAIDCNAAQNALLQLKVVAIRNLHFDEYAAFIGLQEAGGRWREKVLRRLSSEFPPAAREFWSGQKKLVRRGVIYCGRFERHMRRVARLARVLRPRALPMLFSFTDLDVQRRFLAETWDRKAWRLAYRLLLSPAVSRVALRDPAYYAHTAVAVGPTIYERMLRSLERNLARDSFMISLALTGTLSNSDLPPYLTKSGCDVIRRRLHLLSVVDADLVEYLESFPAQQFTHFSLSDVPSYLTESEFHRLLDGVMQCAASGARLVVRQFLTRYELPDHLDGQILREPELEAHLAAEDRSFAYEFLVGTVLHAHS